MKLIALGSNLPSRYGSPEQTILAAFDTISRSKIRIIKYSRLYRSRPVPVSDQPDFINAVVAVATELNPLELLQTLHKIEDAYGRVRQEKNEARVLDLDLLTYDDQVLDMPDRLTVPHPRLEDRAFVLYPLRDVAPNWKHPVSGRSLNDIIAALPANSDHGVEPLESQAA